VNKASPLHQYPEKKKPQAANDDVASALKPIFSELLEGENHRHAHHEQKPWHDKIREVYIMPRTVVNLMVKCTVNIIHEYHQCYREAANDV